MGSLSLGLGEARFWVRVRVRVRVRVQVLTSARHSDMRVAIRALSDEGKERNS